MVLLGFDGGLLRVMFEGNEGAPMAIFIATVGRGPEDGAIRQIETSEI